MKHYYIGFLLMLSLAFSHGAGNNSPEIMLRFDSFALSPAQAQASFLCPPVFEARLFAPNRTW